MPLKHKQKILIVFVMLVSHTLARSQSRVAGKHAFFIEFRGFSGYYSVNYDRILFIPKPFKISARVGLTLLRGEADINNHKTIEYAVPVMLNVLYGKYNHHLEAGTGIHYTVGYYNETNISGKDTVARSIFLGYSLFIGYRYQKPEGGFMFRAGYYPSDDIIREDEGWLGIGIGYAF